MKASACWIFGGLFILSANAETIRYEEPVDVRPIVATGLELRGELDGGSVTEWNTLLSEDGWLTLTSGGARAEVLVLNGPKVEGGRLAANETWTADRIHVVRDDVVIPSGVKLTLTAGCVVKFLPGSRFVTESGGTLRAEGAMLADFADDEVGGDVNMDGGQGSPSGVEWWIEDSATAGLATVRFMDGAKVVSSKRTYTAGVKYGPLPSLTREDARFAGWFTQPESGGIQISENSTVASGETRVYAQWVTLEVNLPIESSEVQPSAGRYSFDVSAVGGWTASTDAGWIEVETDGDEDDGRVWYSVLPNDSTSVRSATIHVVLENGTGRDFTVTQIGMTAIAPPVINPADGTAFNGSSRRVSISCPTADAAIYYTLDGSEPTEASKLYTKSFNVFDTTTVRAKAFKDGMLASDTVSARIVRLQTLGEAINIPLWTVTTDSMHPWTVVMDESKDGTSAARSGEIGDDEESAMEAAVEGSGILSFWWKVSCEDDPDTDAWDYLVAFVDGIEVARIDGVVDWQQVAVKVKGEGAHTIRWVYCKDYMDDLIDVEDCGWVDQVSWTATVGESSVPTSWVEGLGLVRAGESAASAANLDPDGDGFTTAEEYIIGTDPTDPNSKFTASIEMIDGKPIITYEPDLLEERKYTTWGKKDLANPEENWQKVNVGDESDYNFFKMSVELPE